MVRVSTSPIRYELRRIDGSVEEYGQPDGALTFPRKVFLTRSIDPQGNTPRLHLRCEPSPRRSDRLDRTSHDPLRTSCRRQPLKVTKVTDPFGRFATLQYDASGRLSSITDVIGMVSSFTYGASDFIQSMTTPYGTTTFAAFDEGRRRWLETTDPLGGRERLEYVNIGGRCRDRRRAQR